MSAANEAKLYDNLGRVISEQLFMLSNNRYRLGTEKLSQGLYFIRVSKNSEFIFSDKFTIHR
ncbi:MAG: T9SS type A sorting domain-containing protein [Chitinophagales bacterium]|nr:T9SS type A sorting domain-containing protein [Chitinophagales bacterium]